MVLVPSPDGTQIDTLNSLMGNVVNGFGMWTFGPAIVLPTGAGPPGPFGTFNYVKLNGKTIGPRVPFAQAIRIDFGGNVFFLTTENDRWWFQYVGYDADAFFVGSPFIDPSLVVTSPAPPTTFNPPYTPSPDGNAIPRNVGSLTTLDGVWTFGTPSASAYSPNLNGVTIAVRPSDVVQMATSAQGTLFAQMITNLQWYAYLNFDWYLAGATVPVGPIPIEVNFSPNLRQDLTTSSPIGAVVSTISVVMSDGSPFTGAFNFTGGSGELALSGSGPTRNVVIAKPLTAVTQTTYNISVTAAGMTVSAGASQLGVWVFS